MQVKIECFKIPAFMNKNDASVLGIDVVWDDESEIAEPIEIPVSQDVFATFSSLTARLHTIVARFVELSEVSIVEQLLGQSAWHEVQRLFSSIDKRSTIQVSDNEGDSRQTLWLQLTEAGREGKLRNFRGNVEESNETSKNLVDLAQLNALMDSIFSQQDIDGPSRGPE